MLSCLLYFPFMFTGSCCPAEFCLPQSTNPIEGQRYCICTVSLKPQINKTVQKTEKKLSYFLKTHKNQNPQKCLINHCLKFLILFQKSIVPCVPKLPFCCVPLSVISARHRCFWLGSDTPPWGWCTLVVLKLLILSHNFLGASPATDS